MPLNEKGKKIMKSMRKQYGKKRGEQVFYASKNKGTIKGVEKKKKRSKKCKNLIKLKLAQFQQSVEVDPRSKTQLTNF